MSLIKEAWRTARGCCDLSSMLSPVCGRVTCLVSLANVLILEQTAVAQSVRVLRISRDCFDVVDHLAAKDADAFSEAVGAVGVGF